MKTVVPSLIVALLVLSGCGSTGEMQSETADAAPRLVQPGAPGEASRVISVEESRDTGPSYTEADVAFMQGMIGHHAQALDMTALIADRSEHRDLRLLGQRISVSQTDEIAMMQRWLAARGEGVPEATAHHMMAGHMAPMPGMLTPEQMQDLEAASGDEFYRLFLEYMIQHHDGAIIMVNELLSHDGAAQDSQINAFAADVFEDQSMEITRMREMLDRMN